MLVFGEEVPWAVRVAAGGSRMVPSVAAALRVEVARDARTASEQAEVRVLEWVAVVKAAGGRLEEALEEGIEDAAVVVDVAVEQADGQLAGAQYHQL